MTDKSNKAKLENDQLWRRAAKLAEEMYELVDSGIGDEKNISGSVLKSASFHLTDNIARAAGSITSRDKLFSLGYARKDLFSIKNAYRFASGQGLFSLEPAVMVELDNILKEIDESVERAQKFEWQGLYES